MHVYVCDCVGVHADFVCLSGHVGTLWSVQKKEDLSGVCVCVWSEPVSRSSLPLISVLPVAPGPLGIRPAHGLALSTSWHPTTAVNLTQTEVTKRGGEVDVRMSERCLYEWTARYSAK